MARRKIDLPAQNKYPVLSTAAGRAAEKGPLPILCERIRFYREKSGLEQKAFAERIGVTPNAASNWECGRSRPDVNLLPSICRALNITLYDLFGETVPSDPLSEREKMLVHGYRSLDPTNQYVLDKTLETLRFVQNAGNRPEIRTLLF